MKIGFGLVAAALLWAGAGDTVLAQQAKMTFFITSEGNGQGANFGGLAGADRHCQKLATAAGAGFRTWRAYLSQSALGDQPAVHARERIGRGPWQNAKGVVIATDINHLHGPDNKITKDTALTEKWDKVSGRGDTPNMHDILTGSRPDGTAFDGNEDRTCNNWRSGDAGQAMVGHHDRIGLRDDEPSRSWNSSHPSRGCSLEALKMSGGAGLLYCFAID
ncbi:MAG: lectin [Betaproteobacteria bacterium]